MEWEKIIGVTIVPFNKSQNRSKIIRIHTTKILFPNLGMIPSEEAILLTITEYNHDVFIP